MMKGALTITATMLMQDERGRWLPPLHTSQQLPFPNLIFFYSSLLLLYIVNDPTLADKNSGWRINVNKQNTASMATKFSIMRCQKDTVNEANTIELQAVTVDFVSRYVIHTLGTYPPQTAHAGSDRGVPGAS